MLVGREGGEVVVSTGWYALTLFRPASGSGAAPRPKGWIAAAAAGWLAFRPRTGARRVWSGYDAAPERISQSLESVVAGRDGDARCKYI